MQQDTRSSRGRMLADLRQRAEWRRESAAEYDRQGKEYAASYFNGAADAFLSAVYILEHYHPEVGA